MASQKRKSTRTKSSPKRVAPSAAPGRREKRRFWLMYPPRLITTPVMWTLAKKFDVVTNLRQASVTDEIGIVCLELEGSPAVIRAAVTWLGRQGVSVEPVEINVIAS